MAGRLTDAEEVQQKQRQIRRVLDDSDQPMNDTDEHPVEPDIPPDRTRQFRGVNFSRMRTSWKPTDLIIMQEITRQAEEILLTRFADAFDVMDRVFVAVREPARDALGMVMQDSTGRPQWKLNEVGLPTEDWTRLSDVDRLQFLYTITTHLFEWEQSAADQWGQAMYAKGIWEETFAKGFTAPEGKLTVDDRTQHGHLASMEDRYFGIFQSVLSRRADAIIRSMTRIEQRLKDISSL